MITINIYMSTYRGFSTIGSDFATPTVSDFMAAKTDLQNSLNVRKGERVMRPDFGCLIWDMLYEPFTDELEQDLIENITDIGNSDPRLQLLEIEPTSYEHGIQVSIMLQYIPTDQVEKMLYTFNQEASTVTANTGTANGY
jgi:phage baseplate assembly protein W